MSGRDHTLNGFTVTHVDQFYYAKNVCEARPLLDRNRMNVFLSLITGMKVEKVEFFNALDMMHRIQNHTGLLDHQYPLEALFLAAVRVSVFWRRRRDVLSMDNVNVRKLLEAVNSGTEYILEAEGDIMANLGCHVWRSRCNPIELCHIILANSLPQKINEEYRVSLLDVATESCFLLECSLSKPRSSLDIAALAAIASVVICTQTHRVEDVVALICKHTRLDTEKLVLDTKFFLNQLFN
jgi:hypothetical protein